MHEKQRIIKEKNLDKKLLLELQKKESKIKIVYLEFFQYEDKKTFRAEFYNEFCLLHKFDFTNFKDVFYYICGEYPKSTHFYSYNLHKIEKLIFYFLLKKKIKYFSFTNDSNFTYYFKIHKNTKVIYSIFNLKAKFKDSSILETEKKYNLQYNKIFYERIKFLKMLDLNKLTIAGDAMQYFKNSYTKDTFNLVFPQLEEDVEEFAQESVNGGIFFIEEKIKGKKLKNLYYYDINKSYTACAIDNFLPLGIPIYYKGKYKEDDIYNLYIQKIRVVMRLKKKGIAFLRYKENSFFQAKSDNKIIDTNGEIIELVLNNIDIELLFKNYDIEQIKYIEGYKFASRKGIFKNHIEKIQTLQEQQKGNKIIFDLLKYFYNALWGKFSQKKYTIQNDAILKDDAIEFNRKYFKTENIYIQTYSPIFSFITAYGRKKLIEAIEQNRENLIYSNTDSIILNKKAKGIEINKNKLGAFKCEYENATGIFINFNIYKINDNIVLGGGEIDKKNTFFSNREFNEKNVDEFFKLYNNN